jgi:excinuclease UvrABC ATPase subunit
LLGILIRLKEKGNSVYVVEHEPDIIKAAEWLIDIGPKAGKNGGHLVYSGIPAGIKNTESITGRFLYHRERPVYQRKSPHDFIAIKNARVNNLKNVSVNIPRGVLTCITGVAGSGKSSLIHEFFIKQYPSAIVIDQSGIGKSSRANPATYIGVLT